MQTVRSVAGMPTTDVANGPGGLTAFPRDESPTHGEGAVDAHGVCFPPFDVKDFPERFGRPDYRGAADENFNRPDRYRRSIKDLRDGGGGEVAQAAGNDGNTPRRQKLKSGFIGIHRTPRLQFGLWNITVKMPLLLAENDVVAGLHDGERSAAAQHEIRVGIHVERWVGDSRAKMTSVSRIRASSG